MADVEGSYICSVCNHRYLTRKGVACLVLHSPNQCCHYNEEKAPEKVPRHLEARELLGQLGITEVTDEEIETALVVVAVIANSLGVSLERAASRIRRLHSSLLSYAIQGRRRADGD